MEIHRSSFERSTRPQSPTEFFPLPEDWIALQGGKPRVFRQPARPDAAWFVLHVYDEHDDPVKRFMSGALVETLPPDYKSATQHLSITRKNTEGEVIKRDIVIPSFMNRNVHGEPCDVRSRSFGGHDGYSRIVNQPTYVEFLGFLASHKWQELRYGVTKDGLKMLPLPRIRPAKPIKK